MVYPIYDTALCRPIEVELYVGGSDPQDHFDSYCNAMVVTGCHDAVLCKVFPLTLKKEASRWFKALPPQTITGWDTIAYQFVQYFITSKELPCISHTLALVKQDKGEKLKDFLTCFYREVALVLNLGPKDILHLVVQALAPGPFECSLAKTLPRMIHAFQQHSEKYVSLEDRPLRPRNPSTSLQYKSTTSATTTPKDRPKGKGRHT